MRALVILIALLCLAPSRLYAADDELPASTHVLIVDARGASESARSDITRALKQHMGAVIKVSGQAELEAAAAKIGVNAKGLERAAGLAAAGREAGAAYVLVVTVIRRGWLYTARAILINSRTAEQQMDFRADFYDPKSEAPDRGRRIAGRTLKKLPALLRAERAVSAPPPAPPLPPPIVSVESSTASTSTSSLASAGEESPFGGGDSPFGGEESPFGGEESPFGDVSPSSEFDGYESEGGWLWSVRGWIGTSYQAFLHPNFDKAKSRNFNKVGVRFGLTGKLGSELRIRTVALLEADTLEQRLHRAIVEEGFVEWAEKWFEVRLGWDSLTWGAASTLNIIDIVNTRDLTEGVIDAPKVGQPMLALRFPYETHSLSLLYLTPFIASNFPRLDSAFVPFSIPLPPGGPIPRLGDTVVYGGEPGIWHPQAAARVALSFPKIDIRGTYFFGYTRVPIIEPSTLAVVYPLIHHVSTDGQLLIGQTALKWELASVWHVTTDNIRDPGLINPMTGMPVGRIPIPGQRFVWVVGVEHTFEGLIGQTRLTPVVEFVGDSSSEWFTDEPRPDIFSAFTANHLVYGFDWSFENSVGSTLRFIDLWDLANPADHAMIVEYSERWFEHFTFDLGVRWVVAADQNISAGLRPLSGVYTGLKLNY